MIFKERRACEKEELDKWPLEDWMKMNKKRKERNLIADMEGKELPDLNKERELCFYGVVKIYKKEGRGLRSSERMGNRRPTNSHQFSVTHTAPHQNGQTQSMIFKRLYIQLGN